MRKILGRYSAPRPHWVGDGFPVRSLLSHQHQGQEVSPFLLLDYAGSAKFEPTTLRRGVGEHPHRGFETVTIVYEGEVEHRDSTGAGGTIGPGDVQWMTAASGILHAEHHSPAFAAKGGSFEMVQLWVNLPAKNKKAPPGYLACLEPHVPDIDGCEGACRAFVAIIAPRQGHPHCRLACRRWHCPRHRWRLTDAKLLILSGAPINEPVVAQGPFVMNTVGEIKQAMLDFQSGKFGAMKR